LLAVAGNLSGGTLRGSRAVKKPERNSFKGKSKHKYLTGAKGVCYYVNSNGNKTYVKKGNMQLIMPDDE
jgi:hypothetical protein